MTLTADERAAINRKNAARSRGPITEQGKARSRLNAIKHGLRAEMVPLPDEDPEVLFIRRCAWQDYYMPQSPAAQHLVNQCFRATLLADRCDAFHSAALVRQVRDAEQDWEDERDDAVQRLRALLLDDPAEAVRLLRRSGHGCRWMIARWEALGAALESRGFWRPDERAEAIRLQGEHPEPLRTPATAAPPLRARLGLPEPERSRYSDVAFVTHLVSLLCQPVRPAAELARLLEQGRTPYSINGGDRPVTMPEPALCLAELRRIVAEALAELRPREERLRVEFDEPDRAEAGMRARALEEGPARLYLRYQAEARSTFHRAYKELLSTLRYDRSPEGANPKVWSGLDYQLQHLGDTVATRLEPSLPTYGPNYDPAAATPSSPNEPNPGVAMAEAVAEAAGPLSPNEPNPTPVPTTTLSPNEPNPTPVPTTTLSPNEPNPTPVPATATSPNEPNPDAAPAARPTWNLSELLNRSGGRPICPGESAGEGGDTGGPAVDLEGAGAGGRRAIGEGCLEGMSPPTAA